MEEAEWTIEALHNELVWWQKWLAGIPKKYKDQPDQITKHTANALRQINRIKQLIADKRAGRGDRSRKESEADRRRQARGLPKKKKK